MKTFNEWLVNMKESLDGYGRNQNSNDWSDYQPEYERDHEDTGSNVVNLLKKMKDGETISVTVDGRPTRLTRIDDESYQMGKYMIDDMDLYNYKIELSTSDKHRLASVRY